MDKEKEIKEPVEEVKTDVEKKAQNFPPNFIGAIADEVSKTLMSRLPGMRMRTQKKKPKKTSSTKLKSKKNSNRDNK